MSMGRSAGSIFWGLILIGAGVVFLLKNLGFDVPVWAGIARYWPILLIAWGMLKLVDYFRWKRSGQNGPLFGAGEVVLLIVVIFSGTALTAAANMSPDLGYLFEIADIDLWDITGNSYEFSEHYERDVRSASPIEIINRYGSVEVTPADTDRIVVDVAKTVIAPTLADAQEFSDDLTFSIVEEGSRYRVISSLNRDENRVRGRRFRTSLTVRVPRRSSVTINNRNGEVDVADLTGDQNVNNAFGRVSLHRIDGNVRIDSRNDTVVVEDITGSATVNNEFSNTTIRNVGGALEVRHRNGTLDVTEIAGAATLSNAFGPISISGVKGALTIDGRNSSVEVDRADADVKVKTQFENIRLEDVRGGIDVDNRNGATTVRFREPPTRDIRISSRFGDVTLSLPESSSFSADARTRFGRVSTDFSGLFERSDRERNSLSGQVGAGGPEIRIENQNGAIYIENN